MTIGVMAVIAVAQTVISFATIAEGTWSQIDEPREVIVRTDEEWQALWQDHGGGTTAPVIDFSDSTVVGVFLGSRPTGGFRVEITSVTVERGGGGVVEYSEHTPKPGSMVAQVLTAPFQLARLTWKGADLRFRSTDTPLR